MPLYDYRCTSCGHELEALQGINEAPLTECPECGANALVKLPAAPAFNFKGGGWYKDLYGSSTDSKKSSDGDSGAGKSKAAESTDKTESSSNKSTTSGSTAAKSTAAESTAAESTAGKSTASTS